MTNEQQGAAWAKDCMDRQRVAKFLTRHLDESPLIKVLNVNSEWGSGKTFFVTEWQKEIREQRVCVYFDAWKHDYTGDPFVSLVAAIKDQLEEQFGQAAAAKKSLKTFARAAAKTFLATAPVIAKGLVKKVSTVNVDEVSDAAEEASDLPGDVAEKAVESLIESKKEALQSVGEFKKVFADLLKKAADKKGVIDKPAYIFIDELDRCRPTFAIELLERIKHLFDIEGCKFIIASDTVQLAHSITAIYGQGFESHKYLKRFFDAEFTLDNSNMDNWVRTCYQDTPKNAHESINLPMRPAVRNQYISPSSRIEDVDSDTIAMNQTNNFNPRQAVISALEKTFSPKLRELEKLVSQISAFEKNCKSHTFQFFFAAYLLFLKDADRNLYRELINARGPLAGNAVESRFHGYKLYFGDSNVNVHHLADVYFKCLRASPREVSSWMQRDNGPEYVGTIYARFVNDFEDLASYPLLVDLAHRLD